MQVSRGFSFDLIDSLLDKPELRLALTVIGLFGVQPAELRQVEALSTVVVMHCSQLCGLLNRCLLEL